jgi:hypothetical protein
MRWLYDQLRARTIRLPPLLPSSTLSAIARCLGVATAAGGLAKAWTAGDLTVIEILLVTILPGIIAWAIAQLLFNHFFADVSTADTVGELASQILSRNPAFFSCQAAIRLTRGEVNQIVVQILIESCSIGVDPEEVKLSARLVDDLGMD